VALTASGPQPAAAGLRLRCAGRLLELDAAVVMGVLNLTPDSFSDGGLWLDADAALVRAERMAEEGAAIVDIGGESTRPGPHWGSSPKRSCGACCRSSSEWPRACRC
jgi:dihydropteroate synthase